MIKRLSLRMRLTLITAILIAVCCVGLTIVLNVSAYRLVDVIDATKITMPAQEIGTVPMDEIENLEPIPSYPTLEVQQAKQGYRMESILYTMIAVILGSILTYYISGKSLRPVKVLNDQVKNINVHNLSETLDVPPTKDEIAELTKSFNEMTDKLDEAFLMLQRFSASAAHELRTPLAVLQTKIDVFNKKEYHTITEYDALIKSVQNQTGRLRVLVKNLLDMTNLEDGVEQQAINLRELLEDIKEELSHIAKEKNIELCFIGDRSRVFGNLDLLYRAFYNLIENGIKYNVPGGKVEIQLDSKEENKVIVMINDTGIGIPDELKKRIFEPFFRVDKSRSREMGGAGLGLTIVENIIKKHNGTVDVSNNKNGGTSFMVILPKV